MGHVSADGQGARELHSKTSKDFLPRVAFGLQVYDPRDKAPMIWRNLQLIARIDDDRLEEFEVVNINREIRKQAQFHPRRQRQRASTSPNCPPKRPTEP